MAVRANKKPPEIPTDLPDRYKPRSLRPPDSPDFDKFPTVPMYACGYANYEGRDDIKSFGMFAGPTPNLEDMLNIIPQEEEREAYIIRFNPNGTDDILYRWWQKKEVWKRVRR
jgi:hypothetical protein